MLKNTILHVHGIKLEISDIIQIFEDIDISPKARPEELSLEQFLELSDKIHARMEE